MKPKYECAKLKPRFQITLLLFENGAFLVPLGVEIKAL